MDETQLEIIPGIPGEPLSFEEHEAIRKWWREEIVPALEQFAEQHAKDWPFGQSF